MFPSGLYFFRFMADHKAFAFTQRIFHLLQTDFHFQHVAAVRDGKAKYSVVLRRSAWPDPNRNIAKTTSLHHRRLARIAAPGPRSTPGSLAQRQGLASHPLLGVVHHF